MARKAITNREGTMHLHISGDQPEAAELKQHVEAMWAKNTDHAKMPLFNPAVSQRQAKAMYAAAEGRSTLGIPSKVGKDFTKGFKGHPGSVKKLPKHK